MQKRLMINPPIELTPQANMRVYSDAYRSWLGKSLEQKDRNIRKIKSELPGISDDHALSLAIQCAYVVGDVDEFGEV